MMAKDRNMAPVSMMMDHIVGRVTISDFARCRIDLTRVMMRTGRKGAAMLNARRQYLVYEPFNSAGHATIMTSMTSMPMSSKFQTRATCGAGERESMRDDIERKIHQKVPHTQ